MKTHHTQDSQSLASLADLGKLLDQTPPTGQAKEPASVLQYKPHGACGIVTGSSHFLRHVPTGKVVMIDCGMVQGEIDDADGVGPYPIHPSKVDVLLITHAHVDHIGSLLDLLGAGFNGPILCTRVTAQLAVASLEDCLDVRFRFRDSDDDVAAEAKLRQQLKDLPERFIAVDEHVGVGESYPVPGVPGVTVAIYPTSHVIGAVAFRIDAPAEQGLLAAEILFSGDIGPVEDASIHGGLSASRSVPTAMPKVVVLESTYGDRPSRDAEVLSGEVRQARLADVFRGALVAHSAPRFIVPTFSLGRTTDVLLDVIGSVRSNWREMGLSRDDRVEIWCSSTLARVYAPIVRDALLGRNPCGKVSWINPHALALREVGPGLLDRVLSPASEPEVFSLEEEGPSIRLTWGDRPFPSSRLNVWLQSPGVAISGRVAATIMDCACEEDVTLLLVGYTPAKSLARSAQRIAGLSMAEREVAEPLRYERGQGKQAVEVAADEVRMGVVDLAQYYSGHADADSLIRYVSDVCEDADMDVILVHGTDAAREQLAGRLMTERPDLRRPISRVHCPTSSYPWFDVGARRWSFPDMGKLRTAMWLPDEDASRSIQAGEVARRVKQCLASFYGRSKIQHFGSSDQQQVFEFRSQGVVDPVRHHVICLRAAGGVLVQVSSHLGHCQGPDSLRHRCFPWNQFRLVRNIGYTVLQKPGDCLSVRAMIDDPLRSKPVLILTRVGSDNDCAKFISKCMIPSAAAFLPYSEVYRELNDLGVPIKRGTALLYMPGESQPFEVDLANPMKSAAAVIPHLNKQCLEGYLAMADGHARPDEI